MTFLLTIFGAHVPYFDWHFLDHKLWIIRNPIGKMREPVSKCSILFEIKEGENFNRRNMLNISWLRI
jgi:hypothetical protein